MGNNIDHCGVSGTEEGTEEALYAAIAAATVRVSGLAMQPPNPTNLTALNPTLKALFTRQEAEAIADAIVRALQRYSYSKQEAIEAATAAAIYLAQQHIYPYVPPLQVPRHLRNRQIQQQIQQRLQGIQLYNNQQGIADQVAAQTACQKLQLAGVAPIPLVPRNMFNVKDISNMYKLVEPNMICLLHRAMFVAGELQSLEWHWDSKEVYLPPP